KKIVPEYNFSAEQLNRISDLAAETGLTEQITRILYARGIDSAEKIRKFMRPSEKNFLSPFLMKGMKEAVELITQARDEGRTVAVFGDYDADGICASAIMYHALREFGIEPHVYVPERADGYGLSEEAVDRIFEDCNPELFITVDCGISCAKEAQYIYELGSDVIVTDHHELPEVLPDCIVVNPKLKDDYPYDNLCGAGVAFKLACALIGEAAYKYLDFATLATVADSVPLLGENRDIVTEGLKIFNRSLRPCFTELIGKTYDAITAQTLAFNLAPRINAAGRMGDAMAAFNLFVSENPAEIYDLSVKLCAYNTERQKYCDELYLSAKAKLKEKGAFGNVIMLSDEGWNTGFIGIVAARIAEEYNRPTLLFVHHGDMLKGSARSIENVNIFTALKNCSEHIEEFGGHAQAAGINIKVENFSALEAALNAEIGATYSEADFEQRLYVCEEITARFPEKFAKELAMMEPYGVGHRRPQFVISAGACLARPVKNMSPHLSVKSDFIDLVYFSGVKNLKIIESDVRKKIVFDVNLSHYRGRTQVKGYVRDLLYDGRTGRRAADGIFSNEIARCYAEAPKLTIKQLTTEETKLLIERKRKESPYGLCMIASDRRTLRMYGELEETPCDLFYPSSRNVSNLLIVSPAPDADLSGFRDIVFLDTPGDYNLSALDGKEVYVNREICGYKMLESLDTARESLLEIYSALRREIARLSGGSVEELAVYSEGLGFDKREFIFALNVFEELGLISFADGKLTVYRGVKAELTDSGIYRKVCHLQEN
ncbi:MAG: single-stranded-DNA-specific exonuclease RecJ, partial [Clostridia bacterium]|nr:single-stranded-DNA-specific exonuclease RecJ [Clostridia bacterium]